MGLCRLLLYHIRYMALGFLIFMSVICINVKKDLNILFGTDLKKTASELNVSLFICKYKYHFLKGDHHYITEILLKVGLNTINQTV